MLTSYRVGRAAPSDTSTLPPPETHEGAARLIDRNLGPRVMDALHRAQARVTFRKDMEAALARLKGPDGRVSFTDFLGAAREVLSPAKVNAWFKDAIIEPLQEAIATGVADAPDILSKATDFLEKEFRPAVRIMRLVESISRIVLNAAIGGGGLVIKGGFFVVSKTLNLIVILVDVIVKFALGLVEMIIRLTIGTVLGKAIGYMLKPLLAGGIGAAAGAVAGYIGLGWMWGYISEPGAKRILGRTDGAELLRGMASLPIYRFRYRLDPARQVYVGPLAPDFRDRFGELMPNPHMISAEAYHGLTVAAVHALAEQAERQQREITQLEREVAHLERPHHHHRRGGGDSYVWTG